MNAQNLLAKLHARIQKINRVNGAAQALRVLLRNEKIPFVPFGTGNRKIGSDTKALAGFYRKIGDTCPHSCPYLDNGCYGQVGRTLMQQRRAMNAANATIASFLACAVLNHRFCEDWPSRLFVTGDLFKHNKVDRILVKGLKEASKAIQDLYGIEKAGYGYTHGHDKALIQELVDSGMEILESDYLGAGGTFVYPHSKLPQLRAKLAKEGNTVRLAKCPSQINKAKKCSNCNLCLDARKLNLCIIFDPHGSGKAKIKLQVDVENSTQSKPDSEFLVLDSWWSPDQEIPATL